MDTTNTETVLPVGTNKTLGKPTAKALPAITGDVALTGVSTLAEVERSHFEKVFKLADGNKAKAAKALGITVKTVYNKLAQYAQDDKNTVEKLLES